MSTVAPAHLSVRLLAWSAGIAVFAILAGPTDANAFSRGFASKVRALADQAFAERFENARKAYVSGDYKKCVGEAQLALKNAGNDDKAAATRKLLVAAYQHLNDPASAAPHLEWLSSRQKL